MVVLILPSWFWKDWLYCIRLIRPVNSQTFNLFLFVWDWILLRQPRRLTEVANDPRLTWHLTWLFWENCLNYKLCLRVTACRHSYVCILVKNLQRKCENRETFLRFTLQIVLEIFCKVNMWVCCKPKKALLLWKIEHCLRIYVSEPQLLPLWSFGNQQK